MHNHIWARESDELTPSLELHLRDGVTDVEMNIANEVFFINIDDTIIVRFSEIDKETLKRWIAAIEKHDY